MKKMLAIVAALGVSTAAFADLIALVDFGMNTQMTTPGTETWNNLAVAGSPAASPVGPILMGANGGAMNLPSYTLLDTTGASTGWVISVARLTNSLGGIGTSGAGGNYSGTVAPDVAAFAPYSATQDNVYVNNQAIFGVTITGLNDTQTYDLTAFTGRNSANTGANGLWTLTSGTATTARFQNAAGAYTANTGQRVNSTGTDNGFAVEWLGVTPVSGTIAFSIDTANGNGGSNVTDLNALSISQIPEPATFGIVLSAIGVAIIRRRRIG